MTVQEFIDKVQEDINSGRIDGNTELAAEFTYNRDYHMYKKISFADDYDIWDDTHEGRDYIYFRFIPAEDIEELL